MILQEIPTQYNDKYIAYDSDKGQSMKDAVDTKIKLSSEHLVFESPLTLNNFGATVKTKNV